jgi:methyl-accepting chemotaxis protein
LSKLRSIMSGNMCFGLAIKSMIFIVGLVAVVATLSSIRRIQNISLAMDSLAEHQVRDRLSLSAVALARGLGTVSLVRSSDGYVTQIQIVSRGTLAAMSFDKIAIDAGGVDFLMRSDKGEFAAEGKKGTLSVIPQSGDSAVAVALSATRPVTTVVKADGLSGLVAYAPIVMADKSVVGALAVGLPDGAVAAVSQNMIKSVYTTTSGILIGGALAIILTLAIMFRPFGHLTAALSDIAQDKSADVSRYIKRRDEFGSISRAIHKLSDHLGERRRLQAAEVERLTYESQREEMLSAKIAAFDAQIRKVLLDLQSRMLEVEQATTDMHSVGLAVVSGASQMASSADESAATVSAMVSSTEEMNSSICEISMQTEAAAAVTIRADTAMRAAVVDVQSLVDAAARIADVIGMIESITSQTNLLALNATIEAARAGEAGRGFAVVASEVKQLASQTAAATSDIAGQIGSIRSAADRAAVSISGITDLFSQVVETSKAVSAAVTQQAQATGDIGQSIHMAVSATDGARQAVGDVSSRIGAMEQTVVSLARVASGLKDDITDVETSVSNFLSHVRAA